MILIVALIFSVLLAWMGVKKGVYFMAATLFNLLISIYIGMLSTPLVLKTSPGLEESGYYAAFCMLLLIVACFVLLQGICYYFFLRGADLLFPHLFDKAVGGVLGFAGGYAVAGILFLAVCMMPFSRLEMVQKFFPWDGMELFCRQTTSRVCHIMAGWSLEYLENKPEETIKYLVSLGQEEATQPVPVEIKSAAPPGTEAPSKPAANPPKPAPAAPRPAPNPADNSELE